METIVILDVSVYSGTCQEFHAEAWQAAQPLLLTRRGWCLGLSGHDSWQKHDSKYEQFLSSD